MWDATRLAGVRVSANSDYVRSVSWGETILRDASSLRFRDWYGGAAARDLHLAFLTPVDGNFGILWGFGTGEGGEKYWIDPSFKLGFIAREAISGNSDVTLRMSYVMGGHLKERTCTADYGAIGGVRTVNCRLAASILRPEDTLAFLFDEPPEDRVELSVTFNMTF